MSAPFLCTAKFRSSLLLLLSLYALYPCVFPFFPRASAIFLGPSLVKFAPIYSKNRSSPTTFPNTPTLPSSLRSLLFFLFLFSLNQNLSQHTMNLRTHIQSNPPVVRVRLERVHQSRRARSKHKQGQNLTDDELQRRPSSRESPIKLNAGWGCPMKCCRNGPFH